jgi:hypothetical protein
LDPCASVSHLRALESPARRLPEATAMQPCTGRFLSWFIAPAALIAACGDSESSSPASQNGGSSSAGTSGKAGAGQDASGGNSGNAGAHRDASGGTGGSGGTAGSSGAVGSGGTSATGGNAGNAGSQGRAGAEGGTLDLRLPRRCGDGVPCAPGAACSTAAIESGSGCTCDPSGHYFCDPWAGGGAGGGANCPRLNGCSGSAGGDNGSCSVTNGFCTRTCVCPGGTCTTDCSGSGPVSQGTLCDRNYCQTTSGFGSCMVKDGDCEYSVVCNQHEPPTVTGRCD